MGTKEAAVSALLLQQPLGPGFREYNKGRETEFICMCPCRSHSSHKIQGARYLEIQGKNRLSDEVLGRWLRVEDLPLRPGALKPACLMAWLRRSCDLRYSTACRCVQ